MADLHVTLHYLVYYKTVSFSKTMECLPLPHPLHPTYYMYWPLTTYAKLLGVYTHTLDYRYNGNGCMPTQKVPDEKLVFNKICIIMPLCSTKDHFTHSSSSFFCLVANQWTAWAIRIVVLLRVNTIRKTMNTTTINGKRLYIKSYIHLRSFNASETALYKLCGIMYWIDSAHWTSWCL